MNISDGANGQANVWNPVPTIRSWNAWRTRLPWAVFRTRSRTRRFIMKCDDMIAASPE